MIFGFSIFTASLIPAMLIFGFGSRTARLFVTIMLAPTILALPIQIWALFSPDPFDLRLFLFGLVMPLVVALLYRPSVSRWMENRKEWPDPKLEF